MKEYNFWQTLAGGQCRAATLSVRAADTLRLGNFLACEKLRRLTLCSATAMFTARTLPPLHFVCGVVSMTFLCSNFSSLGVMTAWQ